MPLDFHGKRAVVTGGANGIGLGAARVLEEGGAEVWIFDREAAESPRFCLADVASLESLEAAFARSGPPDIVVANAGTVSWEGVTETRSEEWSRILAVNLTGVFHTIRAAAALMKPRRSGAIVITASTNSFDGEAGLIAYNASKAGLLGVLHTAANELGPYGIRVNAVCPGLIRTRLTEAHFSTPEVVKEYFRHIPLGRGGETREVGQAIAFLVSELASFITGAALLVDGGQMAAKFGTWSEETAEFAADHWRLR